MVELSTVKYRRAFEMNILALDTATDACSAAVLMGDEIIERYELAPRRHTALILPMIETVLNECGTRLPEMDALAFGRGPGSFTGVRIAASVVQGLAFAVGLPVVGVSTLAAIAHGTIIRYGVDRVAVALDARRGEVYWGCYMNSAENGVILLNAEQVCLPDEVIVPGDHGWVGAGSAWRIHNEVLQRRLTVSQWWSECYPRASDIAVLGKLLYCRGGNFAAEQSLPVYLRDQVVNKPLIRS